MRTVMDERSKERNLAGVFAAEAAGRSDSGAPNTVGTGRPFCGGDTLATVRCAPDQIGRRPRDPPELGSIERP